MTSHYIGPWIISDKPASVELVEEETARWDIDALEAKRWRVIEKARAALKEFQAAFKAVATKKDRDRQDR
jgi:hypothetical protein